MPLPRHALLLSLALSPIVAVGQIDPLTGRDAAQGVFVNDSAAVRERFALAARMERLRDWDNAADVYQELLRDHAGKVVPSALDADGIITQYRSVAPAVRERISQWPPEGLRVYRDLFGGEADRALEAVTESGPTARRELSRIVEDYFATDAAADAGLRLVDLLLQDGDFPAAAAIVESLLATHPDLGDRRPALLLRLGIARHFNNNDATDTLDQLRQSFPDAEGEVAGQPTVLADALAAVVELDPPVPAAAALGTDWPMPFGSDDRGRVPDTTATIGVERYFQLELPYRSPNNRGMPRTLRDQILADRQSGRSGGILPAVRDGVLYFQDNAAVYAVGLVGGLPVPAWQQTHDDGAYVVDAWSTPRDRTHGVTVTDRHVLAVLGQPDPLAGQTQGGVGNRDPHLACLDRQSGELRWRLSPGDIELPAGMNNDQRGNQSAVSFAGSPAVVDGRIYLRVDRLDGQFRTAHAACIDEATGRVRWVTQLTSSMTMNNVRGRGNIGLLGNDAGAETHLAVASGRIYVSTDAGAMACLDAVDGAVRWLNLYPRPEPEAVQRGRVPRRPSNVRASRPATGGPVIVSEGHVFLLPPDGTHLMVWDADDGAEALRLPREDYDDADTLIGVRDEALVVASDTQIHAINWENFDPAADPLDNLVWAATFLPPADRRHLPAIAARPFLTQSHLYVPTQDRIFRILMRNGMREAFYPKEAEWPEGQGPGELLIVGGQVVLSSASTVTVFADPATIQRQLLAQIEAAPGDPTPILRYAESLFIAGQIGDALDRLIEAAELAKQLDESAADEVFVAALSLGSQIAPIDGPTGEAFFDVAQSLAESAEQLVRLNVTIVPLTEDPARQVTLYQQMLQTEDRRAVRVGVGDGTTTAADLARRRIDELIELHGEAIYAEQAAAAATALAAADSPTAAEAVASRYPNSPAAEQALRRAVALFEENGRTVAASRALRRQLTLADDAAERAAIFEALGRLAAADPRQADLAASRLLRAAELSPDAVLSEPITLPNGEVLDGLKLADAAESLRQSATKLAAEGLPRLDLPPMIVGGQIPDMFAAPIEVPDVNRLLLPPQRFARNDRLLAVRGNQLRLHDSTGEELAVTELDTEPVGAAWLGDSVLVWTGPTLSALDGETLAPVYTLRPFGNNAAAAVVAPNAIDPPVDRGDRAIEVRARLQQVNAQGVLDRDPNDESMGFVLPMAGGDAGVMALTPGAILVATPGGDVVAYDEADGRELWRAEADGGSVPVRVLATPEHVVVAWAGPNGGADLEAYDLADGRRILRREHVGRQRLVNLALDPGGTLVALEPGRVVAYDLNAADAETPKYVSTLPNRPGDGGEPFQVSGSPGQLVVTAGRILVLADTQTEDRMVWALNLDDGEPMRFDEDGPAAVFAPGPGAGPRVRMVTSGGRFWLYGEQTLSAYDLDAAGRTWQGLNYGLLPARDVVLLVQQPERPVRGRTPTPSDLVVQAYSRMTDGGNDGGLLIHEAPLPGRVLPGQWQALDGAFAYLTRDNILRLLPTNSAAVE